LRYITTSKDDIIVTTVCEHLFDIVMLTTILNDTIYQIVHIVFAFSAHKLTIIPETMMHAIF